MNFPPKIQLALEQCKHDKKFLSRHLEYLDLAFISAQQETLSENNLLLGILHWDTFNKQTLMLKERHELIKSAVESLEKQANGKKFLLVAPEYFYSRPLADSFETHLSNVNHEHSAIDYLSKKIYLGFYAENKQYPPNSIRQLEENSYKEIMCFLKNLSHQHPKLILFPGTIAYRQNLGQEKQNIFRIKKRIEDNLKNVSFQRDGLSTFFYNFNFQDEFKSKSEDDKIQCLKNFKYVAKNTAPCFYKGKKLFVQNKVFNFSEITDGRPKINGIIDLYAKHIPDTFFLPGVYQGEVAKINELSFAIEICADHRRGFLKQSLDKKKDGQPITFHICESASVKEKLTAQCQSIGGYFIHASAKLDYNTVIKRENEFFYKKEAPYLDEKISVLHTEKNKKLSAKKIEKGQATLSFFKLCTSARTSETIITDSTKRRMSM